MNATTHTRILIAAIGASDCGDDGIGPLVAKRLAGRLPSDASLLARRGDMLGLIDDWAGFDALICIDAAAPMGAPGHIHRIDALEGELPAKLSPASSHALGLAEAFALARGLGVLPKRAVVYAVEGACFDIGAPMTPAVAEAADAAARQVLDEVHRLRAFEGEALPHV